MNETNLAVLRILVEQDREQLLTWRNSPDVAQYMYTDHHISPTEHNHWFDGIKDDARRSYWLIESDGRPVGLANFYDIDRHNQRCSWAYYLADTAVRGKGIGSLVEYLMIEKAFNELDINKLWCEVLETNEAVWKLHQKFGFQIEARLRQHIVKDGKHLDIMGLGLLKADWDMSRKSMQARIDSIALRHAGQTR